MATVQKLSIGMHPMRVFGDEFDDGSFCWMIKGGELWLSMIIIKEEHRRKGVLHRLLDAAKDICDVVIIPEPMDKLRWIMRILQGKPYADQMVVTQEWLPLMIDHLKAMQKQEIST